MRALLVLGCVVFALVCIVTMFVKYGIWALFLAMLLASFYAALLMLMFVEEDDDG